jgi:nitric oxide reductase NorD protein
VEDSRQAIFEARASGIYPFCLTVDRDASEYLPRIFGQSGHTIVQRPEQLPAALLGAVRALIKRS